jgi:hypothetical protein
MRDAARKTVPKAAAAEAPPPPGAAEAFTWIVAIMRLL